MKLYEAENLIRNIFTRNAHGASITFHDTPLVLPKEKIFTDHQEISDYINTTIANSTIQANYRPHSVSLRKRKGHSAAHYESHQGIIAIPEKSWAMREIVVLHEIAHHLHHEQKCRCLWEKGAQKTQQKKIIPHDQNFLNIYVEICGIALGEHAEFLFRTTFIEAGIWGKNRRN